MSTSVRCAQVLLIEDDPGDADLILIALRGCSHPRFQVVHRLTLAEGLGELQQNSRIEVVLLDLSLPDAHGADTVKRVRESVPDLPIVILTGLEDEAFSQRMLDLGAQDYLVKGEVGGAAVARAIRYAIARMHLGIERESLVKELRASVEMKNKMFGVLAHDLRNPIGVISGWVELTELTEAEQISEKVQVALRAIADSANFMNALIADVLAVAVAEAAEVTLQKQKFDLAGLIGKAAEEALFAAGQKNLRLVTELLPAPITADKVKIHQVLNNLIANAIKFSYPGAEIILTVRSLEEECVFSITDHGAGIPPAIRGKLFQPFCKGQKGTSGERTNGLGLYICSRIIAAHQGRIDVESEEGKGTVFSVSLPKD